MNLGMYRKYKLGHFFLLVLILLVCIVSFMVYGWRKNYNANQWDENNVDIAAPYYKTPASNAEGEEHEATSTEESVKKMKEPASEGKGIENKQTGDTAHKAPVE